jgi:hypothetical protein
MPLHPHLNDNGGKGVLTGAAGGSMVPLDVEADKRLQCG